MRRLTPVQKWLAGLMAGAFLFLGLWVVPELMGVFNPAEEDTYSEIIFDLPLGWVLVVAGAHLLAGVMFVWSAGHFIEGWSRRKDR